METSATPPGSKDAFDWSSRGVAALNPWLQAVTPPGWMQGRGGRHFAAMDHYGLRTSKDLQPRVAASSVSRSRYGAPSSHKMPPIKIVHATR